MIRSQSKVQLIALIACLSIPAALAACSLTQENFSLLQTVIPVTATPAVEQPLIQVISNSGPTPTVFIIASSTTAPVDPAIVQNLMAEPTRVAPAMTTTSGKSNVCDRVAPGVPIDVTIPDGTRFRPGEAFSKTWRLINTGTCTWTQKYSVIWFSGQPLGIAPPQAMAGVVQPGESVDITVDMVAPQQPGTYQGNWKLRNAEGQLFGLGPNGDAPFWVQIEVAPENTPTSQTQPSEAPTLTIYAAGAANMIILDGLDLDSGQLNRADDDDFVYKLDGQEKPQFMPENGARIAFFGSHEPGESQCQTAVLGTGPLVLAGVDEGAYLCYQTSQGLPGFLRVDQPVEGDAVVSLDFVTWTVP